jgi:crotonobetainyl-CoA:carnitine CoA-transferase CaiB-like acyl-CoA transferase
VSHEPMKGVRVLEVAQFTYTPSASAVLADWGADVIKVEHAVSGDAQRGLQVGVASQSAGSFKPIMEHPNRGKRSIGLALEYPEALGVLYDLARQSDVFLTNFLPAARRRLHIDVADIRAINEKIIYVRGSAFGSKGPDSERGGYDSTGFWARSGSASGVTPPDADSPLPMPGPAYGDSIGGMTIAGGISAALFARERTGETSVVDVSLLSVGAWAMGLAVDISLLNNEAMAPMSSGAGAPRNPTIGNFRTSDGRWIVLSMLQPGRYWADFCRHIEREDLVADERFATVELLMQNAPEAAAIVAETIAGLTFAEWASRFETLEGQWAPVQNPLEVGMDAQLRANGYIASVTDADGVERELVANPVQFDEVPASLRRAPQFAEHTDAILRDLGRTDDEILEYKIAGAVT